MFPVSLAVLAARGVLVGLKFSSFHLQQALPTSVAQLAALPCDYSAGSWQSASCEKQEEDLSRSVCVSLTFVLPPTVPLVSHTHLFQPPHYESECRCFLLSLSLVLPI